MSTKADVSGECSSLIFSLANGLLLFPKMEIRKCLGERLNMLHAKTRKSVGRKKSPSFDIIDSRSVKTSHYVETDRDIDWNKKIKGEKRAYRC